MSIDQRIHFVGNRCADDNLEVLCSLPWEKGTVACLHQTWVWPLFCHLRDRGAPVSFSYEPMPDHINMIHGEIARYQLKGRDPGRFFFVGIRADFKPFPYGNFEIVQNLRTEGKKRKYVPLYSQPGLNPRDVSRTSIENICFSGQLENLGVDLTRLEKDLRNIGCRFVHKSVGQWQNMQDVDVLIGVRSLDKKTYDDKPPSKLFNAWLGNIPFIGGYDSAFSQVGTPGKDYIRVSTYSELLAEIEQLKYDDVYYRKLVESGMESVQ